MRARGNGRRPIDWDALHRGGERLADAVARGWAPDAEARERILKARARALARPLIASQADDAGTLDVIAFRLADEHYAIESAFVAEVFPLVELTRLPCVPPFVLGIVNLRGEIVSVVDLKRFFDLPDQRLGDLNRVILLQGDAMAFGILADRVDGVRRLRVSALQPGLPTFTDRRQAYLKGIADGRVVVLDAAALLADPAMVVHETVEARDADEAKGRP